MHVAFEEAQQAIEAAVDMAYCCQEASVSLLLVLSMDMAHELDRRRGGLICDDGRSS
jgi:hypothetical protein